MIYTVFVRKLIYVDYRFFVSLLSILSELIKNDNFEIAKVIVLYRTIKIQYSLNRTNQSTIIKEAINSYLDKGVTDKQDIYTKVVDELGVPRPTVRRVARDLRTELLQKIQILQSDMPKATVATTEEDE
jgi:hypothetical protein